MSSTDTSVVIEPEAVAPRGRTRHWCRELVSGRKPFFALAQSIGAQFLVLSVNIVTGILTARLLGVEGRGIYAAMTLWPPLLDKFAVAGLNRAIVVDVRKRPDALGSIASTALLLGSGGALLTIGIGILITPLFMRNYDSTAVLFAQICLLNVLFSSFQCVFKQTFAGMGRFAECNLMHLLPQVTHLLLLLALIPFGAVNEYTAAGALLGAVALVVFGMAPTFLRLVKPQVDGLVTQSKRLVSFSARAALTDIVFVLLTYVDKLVLLPLLSARDFALYAVAFSFSRVVQLVLPAMTSVVLSHMSGQSELHSKHFHDTACRFLLVAMGGACALLWWTGEWLLGFAYGTEFAAANTLFRLLVIEASLVTLSNVTVQLFLARERPGVVSSIQVIVLCAALAALLWLVPHYGATGAALAMVFASALRWVLLLAAMRGVLKLSLPRLYLNGEDLRYLAQRVRS